MLNYEYSLAGTKRSTEEIVSNTLVKRSRPQPLSVVDPMFKILELRLPNPTGAEVDRETWQVLKDEG